MRLAKLAVASVSPTVGAVVSNRARLVAVAREMAAADVTLAAFPEQVLGGYPPEDLVQWRAFLDGQRRSIEAFAAETADCPTVFVVGLAVPAGAQIFNCAAVVHGGQILGLVPKEKLPTYNVFYEGRTFSRGGPGLALDAAGLPLGDYVFDFDFGRLAVEVCEDAWSPDGPMRRRSYWAPRSSSTSRPRRTDGHRLDASRDAGDARRRHPGRAAYANAVGGQDGL